MKANSEINVLFPPYPLVAAKGDLRTDDISAIQAIINFAQNNGYGTVFLPYTPNGYKLGDTLTVDPSKIQLKGEGVKLNFINTGIGINFASSSSLNVTYSNNIRPLEGFEIIGLGRNISTTSVGIQFSNTTGNYAPMVNVKNCSIRGFYKGITWGCNTWLTTHDKVNVYDCVYDVFFPNGLVNAGEQLAFNNCAFFNSDYGIYNAGCQMRFTNCSFDYINYKFIECTGGAVIWLSNPHIEGSSDNDHWLYASGSTSTIVLQGGSIAINGTKTNYSIGRGAASDGGIHLDSVFLLFGNNGVYSKQTLVTGWGTCRNLLPYANALSKVNIQGVDNCNYLINGTFEITTVDEWTSEGTANSSYDKTTFRGGTTSQKFAATSGQWIKKLIDVPCLPGQKPKLSIWLKFNFNNSVDKYYITAYFLDALGKQQSSSTYTLTIDSTLVNATQWQLFKINPYTPGYPGVRNCRFIIQQASPTNLSDGLACMWVDDAILTIE
ncbi:hypothetical protein [Peribacillus frigoritolerans]|uniref:hypothetical protein n=1 Tax=Peribacillus frigoritolerans TaxID=450367 RepID=UPI002E223A6B|nr:hypothetical protein [Peribacillus frigoritolerans]MED3845530.1 hypothetical protein [Peribacillus frigoritolerans]